MAGKHDKIKDSDRDSILVKNLDRCWVCGRQGTHIHEVFGGAFRARSKEDGMCVGLCPYHHNGSNEGVHYNAELDNKLKVFAQKEWEKTYGDRDAFIKRFGKNYIMEDN